MSPRLRREDTLGARCIRKASERALSFDVIDAFDDTLECLIAALLQQTPVISARWSAEVGRIAEGSSRVLVIWVRCSEEVGRSAEKITLRADAESDRITESRVEDFPRFACGLSGSILHGAWKLQGAWK